MQFLKGLAITLLSLLLFLSLSVFSLVFMLNQTFLNPDFVVSQMNKLDLSSLVRETGIIDQFSQQIGQDIGQQFPQARALVRGVLNNTMADLEPWIKEKTNEVIYATYDYLIGKSQSLSLVISLEPVKDSLGANLRETLLETPPPELVAAPPAMREQILSAIEQQATQAIPATFAINESMFPPEVRETLEQARQYVGYAQTAYPVLIGFMALLALLIVLIYRQVKGPTRSLGSTLLTYGVLGYGGIFASQYFIGTQIGALGLPTALQAWLPQFTSDLLAPLQTFNIAVAVTGLVLVIVSIVYPQKPSLAD